MGDIRHREFALIAGSRYFNLFAEYIVLLVTALLLAPEDRGEYVMFVSEISLFSMVASVAFEQYGSAFSAKYSTRFKVNNYFIGIIYVALLVSICATAFSFTIVKDDALISILVGITVFAMTIYKQSIVIYQVNENIIQYSKLFLLGKFQYFVLVIAAAYYFHAVVPMLLALCISSVIHAAIVAFLNTTIIFNEKLDVRHFQQFFHKIKWLYATSIVTGLYGFVDLYIIYSHVSKGDLSSYNLAIQFNVAIAVLGQAYAVYIYSDRARNSLGNVIRSTRKVNVLIFALSFLAIVVVYSLPFQWLINALFHESYPELYSVICKTIWLLPAALISMFYAPLWIMAERYVLLLVISLVSIALFTFCALQMISKGLLGVIYAQYIAGFVGFFINYSYYRYAKYEYEKR